MSNDIQHKSFWSPVANQDKSLYIIKKQVMKSKIKWALKGFLFSFKVSAVCAIVGLLFYFSLSNWPWLTVGFLAAAFVVGLAYVKYAEYIDDHYNN